MKPYSSMRLQSSRSPLRQTEELCDRLIILPGGAQMRPVEVDRVCEVIKEIVGQ